MKYIGGKFRLRKWICGILNKYRKPNQTFVDMFVGGASIVREMTGSRIANDIDRDLIAFYRGLQRGWIPPSDLTKDDYYRQYQRWCGGESDALIGFMKFFCGMFGGAWGGFAISNGTSNGPICRPIYYSQANDSLKLAEQLTGVYLHSVDYRDVFAQLDSPCLVYCDPPYADMYNSYNISFDSELFWKFVREQSHKHTIIVSEESAPKDFKSISMEIIDPRINARRTGKADIRVEHLYILKGKEI